MDFKNLAIFALLGSVAAFWAQLRAFFARIFSIFIRTDTITDHIGTDVARYLVENSKIVRWGNLTWSQLDFSKNLEGKDIWIYPYYLMDKSLILIYKNRVPIIIKHKGYSLSVTYFYKTIDVKGIITSCYKVFLDDIITKSSKARTTYSYDEVSGNDGMSKDDALPNWRSVGDLANSKSNSLQNGEPDLFIPPEWMGKKLSYILHKEKDFDETPKKESRYYWTEEANLLRRDVEYWARNHSWFVERKIPHRRSALLFGKPGTGKSRMIDEVARSLNISIKRLCISNMSDKEFTNNFHCHQVYGIILIEDIDVVFRERENVLTQFSLTKNLLSFDTFINTISSPKHNNGVYLVVTTNHPETLDPALTRKGRLDLKLEIKDLDEVGRRHICSNILRDWPEEMEKFIKETGPVPASEFEGLAIERAMDLFYQKMEKDLNVVSNEPSKNLN